MVNITDNGIIYFFYGHVQYHGSSQAARHSEQCRMVMFNNSIAMLNYHEGKQDFSSVVNLGAHPGFSFLW